MSKRFSKQSINWAELQKLVPPDEKGKFLAFKAKADAYLRRVNANPPELPKIDWKKYQALVPITGMVEKFQREYEALKVPYPEDTLTASIEAQWKSLQPEIKAFCDERDKDIAEISKELDRIKKLPKFEEMTMESLYDLYPDQALDPVNRPTFWPHDEESQIGFVVKEKVTKK